MRIAPAAALAATGWLAVAPAGVPHAAAQKPAKPQAPGQQAECWEPTSRPSARTGRGARAFAAFSGATEPRNMSGTDFCGSYHFAVTAGR